MESHHLDPLLGLTEGDAAERAGRLDEQEKLHATEGTIESLRVSVYALQLENAQLHKELDRLAGTVRLLVKNARTTREIEKILAKAIDPNVALPDDDLAPQLRLVTNTDEGAS